MSCGSGSRSRRRECSYPDPFCKGTPCDGFGQENERCTNRNCLSAAGTTTTSTTQAASTWRTTTSSPVLNGGFVEGQCKIGWECKKRGSCPEFEKQWAYMKTLSKSSPVYKSLFKTLVSLVCNKSEHGVCCKQDARLKTVLNTGQTTIQKVSVSQSWKPEDNVTTQVISLHPPQASSQGPCDYKCNHEGGCDVFYTGLIEGDQSIRVVPSGPFHSPPRAAASPSPLGVVARAPRPSARSATRCSGTPASPNHLPKVRTYICSVRAGESHWKVLC